MFSRDASTDTRTADTLAARLVAARYQGLFLALPRGADGVLAEAGDAEVAALVVDRGASGEARFLAAELWFDGHRELPDGADAADVAAVYARALAEGWTGAANPWGLPGTIGPVGRHLMRLGAAAVPALSARLDDETPVVYGGSEEAALGDRYGYRVKDLAAFYAARLAPVPYAVVDTPGARDREIAAMRALLP